MFTLAVINLILTFFVASPRFTQLPESNQDFWQGTPNQHIHHHKHAIRRLDCAVRKEKMMKKKEKGGKGLAAAMCICDTQR